MTQHKTQRRRQALTLTALLVGSSVLVACTGLIMKVKLKGSVGGYDKQMAMAVPFLLLHDDAALRQPKVPEPPETTPLIIETVPQTLPPAVSSPQEQVPPETTPETTPETAPSAIYGEDESWFDDALFIGDSRMVSLSQYARLGQADYFADVGLTVYQMFTKSASDENFSSMTLEELLSTRQYGKIYVMLGLNEAGYPIDSLKEQYRECIGQMQQLQPEATVYLLLVYGVTRGKAAATSYLTPEHLSQVNAAIVSLCDGDKIRCLDPRPLYEDEQGYLKEDYTGDGAHPYGKYNALMAQWLCETVGGTNKITGRAIDKPGLSVG